MDMHEQLSWELLEERQKNLRVGALFKAYVGQRSWEDVHDEFAA